jgi:beta-lactamase superfamily II metal-dependent hydrolase
MGCLLLIALAATVARAQAVRRPLEIHHIDVEGGAATLIVTPAGESILVDAGWPGFDGRDARRIRQAMRRAGVTDLDHLIMTHYHTDHYGGIPMIAQQVHVRRFYDHGPLASLDEDRDFAAKYAAYEAVAGDRRRTLHPGDAIPLRRPAGTPPISLYVLGARGEVAPSKGMSGPENPACRAATTRAEDKTDNARSIVLLLRYGAFDFFDAGDLTWNIEHRLACPAYLVGEVDLYQVTHHGANTSNNTALLASLRPTVAIMNNGARKGGHPEVVRALRDLPSLKALYQLHRNVTSTTEENAPAAYIANLEEQPDEGHPITVSVQTDGRAFSVTNGRTLERQVYQVK